MIPFVLLLLAADTVGRWALGTVRFTSRVEAVAYRLLVGLCVCAVLAVATGSVSLWLADAVFCVILVVRVVLRIAGKSWCTPRIQPEPGRRSTPLERIALVSVMISLGLALLAACAPVTSWDACAAHLAVPAVHVQTGRIDVFEGNAYSAYPHLMHTLYTVGLFHGGETWAVLINWVFAAAGCAVAYTLANRIAGKTAGMVAAAAVATAPIFADQAGTGSIDLAFSVLVLAALGALVAWRQEPAPQPLSWLILAGFLAGSSCGVRHTGYLVCVLLLVTVAFSPGTKRWRGLAWFAAMVAIGAGPWMLRTALEVGNPVYPFFLEVFSGKAAPDMQVTSFMTHSTLQGTGIVDLVLFPWRMIMSPDHYDGWTKSPGPLVLVLGLPGLFVGGKRCRWLVGFCLAGIVCLFFYRQLTRYYLPFFLPMLVVAGVASVRLEKLHRLVAVVLVVTFAYGLALHAAAIHFKVPAALRLESREDYLEKRVERYPAFAWVNEELAGKPGTILTHDPRTYYLDRPSYRNYEALRQQLFGRPVDDVVAWFRERDIRYVLRADAYMWCPADELSIFSQWWDDDRFTLIHEFEFSESRTGKAETVQVYELAAIEHPAGMQATFAGIDFVWIPAGQMTQGAYRSNGALPIRQVKISRGFWLGKHEVTQEQWEAVMDSNPSKFREKGFPVESVSWKDAREFTNRLSELGSGKFRLPTEAEWEYAYKAARRQQNEEEEKEPLLHEIAWFSASSNPRDSTTHAVATKIPNAWGLHDMLGNVTEWCLDTYMGYGESNGVVVDPVTLPDKSKWYDSKVTRGGSYSSLDFECTCAYRDYYPPEMTLPRIGLRLVREAATAELPD